MKNFDVGKNNCMVDMAVSADKGPFLGVEKANDNLQRALDRFLTYHEKEKKVRHLCTLSPCSTIHVCQGRLYHLYQSVPKMSNYPKRSDLEIIDIMHDHVTLVSAKPNFEYFLSSRARR